MGWPSHALATTSPMQPSKRTARACRTFWSNFWWSSSKVGLPRITTRISEKSLVSGDCQIHFRLIQKIYQAKITGWRLVAPNKYAGQLEPPQVWPNINNVWNYQPHWLLGRLVDAFVGDRWFKTGTWLWGSASSHNVAGFAQACSTFDEDADADDDDYDHDDNDSDDDDDEKISYS